MPRKKKEVNNKKTEDIGGFLKKTYLDEASFLKLRLHQKDSTIHQKAMEFKKAQITIAEKDRDIFLHELRSLEGKVESLKKKYKDILKEIEEKTGVNVDGKIINPMTLEIIDDNKGE